MSNGILKDMRTREFMYPVRIIYTEGNVQNAESLLKEKALQITTQEPDCVTLRNEGDGKEACIVLDFGREIHGAVRLLTFKISEKSMANVKITMGESVAESMSTIGYKNATNDHAIRDYEICLPRYGDYTTGESGFRFVCIRLKDANTELSIKAIVAVAIYKEMEYKGSFRSSSEKLNRIFDTAAYTCHLCVQEYIIEGIKRDRLVWVGDMHPQVLTLRSVFGNIEDVEKTIRFTRESTPLPNWMNKYPTYSIWWLLILYDWYLYSGNLVFMDENKEYVLGLTKQLLEHVLEDGSDILPQHFLDWPCHEKPEEITGSRALMVIGLRACEKMAILYKDEDLAKECERKRDLLLSCKEQSYGAKQVAAMLALAGYLDTEHAAEEILEGGAKGWSTFMSYYLLKVAGTKDMAATLKGLEEYYGAMLDMGATTFWEDFNLDWLENATPIDEVVPEGKKDIHGDCGAYCYEGYRHSFCHGWSSAPTAFLLEDVIGIKIAAAGCRVIEISPNLGDLEWAEGTYPTPYGIIKVTCKKNAGGAVETTVVAPKEITIIGGSHVIQEK